MAGNKHSKAIGYVHDLLLSLERNVRQHPPGAAHAIATLVSLYRSTNAGVDLASVVRDAIAPVRHESGFHVIDLNDDATGRRARSDDAEVPDVVRIVTPLGDLAFWFPDAKAGRWMRLSGRIESMLLEQLLRADGFPVFGRDLEALKDCGRGWTKVVWRINDYAPGGDRYRLVESCGLPARRRGQRRKANPEEERPDDRQFLIRPHLWNIQTLRVGALREAEATVLERFGRPTPRDAAT